MGDDDTGDHIHVRCDQDLKRLVNRAAAFNDKNLSEYVRDTLNEAASDDLPAEVQPAN